MEATEIQLVSKLSFSQKIWNTMRWLRNSKTRSAFFVSQTGGTTQNCYEMARAKRQLKRKLRGREMQD